MLNRETDPDRALIDAFLREKGALQVPIGFGLEKLVADEMMMDERGQLHAKGLGSSNGKYNPQIIKPKLNAAAKTFPRKRR